MGRTKRMASMVALTTAGCLYSPRPHTSYEAHSQALALPTVIVYQDSTGALSYQTPTGRDAGKLAPGARAEGRACQRGIQLPLLAPLYALADVKATGSMWLSTGWGDGAYRAAMADLRRSQPADALFYDVRADMDVRMILSVYREECLVLDAGVLMPMPATAPTVATPASPSAPP